MDQPPRNFSFPAIFSRLGGYALSLLVMGLAVHFFLPQLSAFERAAQVAKSMNLWWLGLAALAEILVIICGGYLLCALLGMAGASLSLWRATLISLAAASIGLVTGGIVAAAAITYRWTRKQGANTEGAMLASWLPPILFNIGLVVISIIGMAYLLFSRRLTEAQVSGFGFAILFLALVVLGAWWAARHRERIIVWMVTLSRHWAGWRRRSFDAEGVEERARRIIGAWDVLATGKRRHLAAAALLMVLLDMTSLYLVFRSAGIAPSPGVLMAGYALPMLIGRSVPVPGGVGVIEGTMVALYAGLGVPNNTGVTVVLIYRLLSFWLPAAVGLLVALYIQHHPSMQAKVIKY